MISRFFSILIAFVTALGFAACDASAELNLLEELETCGLEKGEEHGVRQVVDGDTFEIDDGRQVRIVGLQAPKLPLGRKNFKTWPLADEAKDALVGLLSGRRVTLLYGGAREDRHGRILAHVLVSNPSSGAFDLWVEREMLNAGLARVYSFRDNRACLGRLLEAEQSARQAGRGIWAHSYYDIRNAQEAGNHLDSFQLVEGRVVDVAQVSSGVYLNFGQDWRTDFTIFVAKRDLRRFEAAGFDLMLLDGERIRTRGWLDLKNGPMIEVTHPEQIEVLE